MAANSARRQTTFERGGVIPASLDKGAKRQITLVNCGQVDRGNDDDFMLLAGPPAQARIEAVKVFPNVQMYHAAAEADTWAFDLVNATTGNSLNSAASSLSGVTLAATAYKAITVDQNQVIGAGEGLQVQLTSSGNAQTMDQCMVQVEWTPVLGE